MGRARVNQDPCGYKCSRCIEAMVWRGVQASQESVLSVTSRTSLHSVQKVLIVPAANSSFKVRLSYAGSFPGGSRRARLYITVLNRQAANYSLKVFNVCNTDCLYLFRDGATLLNFMRLKKSSLLETKLCLVRIASWRNWFESGLT